MLKPTWPLIVLASIGATFPISQLPAAQTGAARRVLAADDSTHRLAIVAQDGSIEWETKIDAIHDASVLSNGNTLIGAGNGHSVLEVTPDKKIVWKIEQNDLAGITLAWVTRVERLSNGNTLIGNCHAGPDNPQFLEVTPDKRVVWTFKDFQNFGNSMPVQAVLPAR